jgi:head-tail adaptor
MRAGLMKQVVTLQSPEERVSASGSVALVWRDYATVRAELLALSSSDRAFGFGEADHGSLVFRIRSFHGVEISHRLIHRGQVYELTAVRELGNRLMELSCEAVK